MNTTRISVASLIAGILGGILLLPFSGMAEAFYVKIDGADDQAGTENRPLATIQQAVDRAEPGDVIRIGPGMFRESIVIQRSGEDGAPIVLEGTRGPEGEWLTRIDSGELVPSETWEAAPQVGPNVFRNDQLSYEPGLLSVDGLFVPHLHRRVGRTLEMLAWPADRLEQTRSGRPVPFWDAVGGIFAFDPDQENVTYLRLADGADPRDHTVAASRGPTVSIDNAAHVVLRDLEIGGGEFGVRIRGEAAKNNTIEDCHITNGRRRIYLTNGTAGNAIKNNRLTIGYIGARPGPWMGGDDDDETAAIREYIYNYFKFFAGPGDTSDDRSIMIDSGTQDTRIVDNHLEGGLIGIQISDTSGLRIQGNAIHDFSSVGITLRESIDDVHVVDNLIYDCNINLRPHNLNLGDGHRAYIYRNRLLQQSDLGAHIFCHAVAGHDDAAYPDPIIFIYHNTAYGGNRAINLPPYESLGRYLPQFKLINNILISEVSVIGNFPMEPSDAIGVFDYNQLGGRFGLSFPNRQRPAWVRQTNIVDSEADPFAVNEFPDVTLPTHSPARNAGVDLSRPFQLGGRTYEPLPGMKPGYFSGERPDMGARQLFNDE